MTEINMEDRATGLAMRRGAMRRCPACGKGALYQGYLKVRDTCPACGEALHHHRADDAPAYFVILIVGHLVVGLALPVEAAFHPPMWVHAALWLPLALIGSLALLGPIKGAIVGLQWALRMHGFQADAVPDRAGP